MRPAAAKIALALLAAGALGLAPRVARAEVAWRGDFETGDISQWTKAQEVSPDRLRVVTSPVRQGHYALRAEVRQGDDPINASGNRAELVRSVPENEGHEEYVGWSVMWPEDYPSADTWQLFTQWHHSGSSGSPPIEFYVRGEQVMLRLQASQVVWTAPLERGVWHDFAMHVKWSSDPKVGFVELWYDGELVLPLTHIANMFPGQYNILKQGLYRNDSISQVGVVYHDAMTIGSTLEDVMPASAGTPGDGSAGTPGDGSAGTPGDGSATGDDGTTAGGDTGAQPGDPVVQPDDPSADPYAGDPHADEPGGIGCSAAPGRGGRGSRALAIGAVFLVGFALVRTLTRLRPRR